MGSFVDSAVRNNGEWCDAVCRAHGGRCEFSEGLWMNHVPSPALYPNGVTLCGNKQAHQLELIGRLRQEIDGSFAVKDSYSALDLSRKGFRKLFDASWIGLLPSARNHEAETTQVWSAVLEPDELIEWEKAWDAADHPRTFPASLLSEPGILFHAGRIKGEIVSGAVTNVTGDVIGWSNFFDLTGDSNESRSSGIGHVRTLYSHTPIVGYESGSDLEESLLLGFEVLGPLSVWLRK
jgi:hypothetical protein